MPRPDHEPTDAQIFASVNAGLEQLKGHLGTVTFDKALDADEKAAVADPSRTNLIKIVDAVQKKGKKDAASFVAWVLAFLIHWKETKKNPLKFTENPCQLTITVPPHQASTIDFKKDKCGSAKAYVDAIEAKLKGCKVFDLDEYNIVKALTDLHKSVK